MPARCLPSCLTVGRPMPAGFLNKLLRLTFILPERRGWGSRRGVGVAPSRPDIRTRSTALQFLASRSTRISIPPGNPSSRGILFQRQGFCCNSEIALQGRSGSQDVRLGQRSVA
jgi:hypothetical protein